MTALAQIEETLSKLTTGELAEVQTMLDRLQKPVHREAAQPERRSRPTYEEIKPLLEKKELTDEELQKIEDYNGLFTPLPRRPGPPVTNEMIRQLREELGV